MLLHEYQPLQVGQLCKGFFVYNCLLYCTVQHSTEQYEAEQTDKQLRILLKCIISSSKSDHYSIMLASLMFSYIITQITTVPLLCPDTFFQTTNLRNCIPPKFSDRQGKVCCITFSNSSLEPTENSKPKMKRQLVFALLINPSSMILSYNNTENVGNLYFYCLLFKNLPRPRVTYTT